MKKVAASACAFVAGLLVVVTLLEALLRALPVPMGLYRNEDWRRWPLVNYEAHRPYTSSMSWEMRHPRRGWTNNYGQLSPFDFVPGVGPVIVVGDSFIESQMNRYEDTLQGQLGELLGRREFVYGLGANGLSLSDYLALSAMAADEFAPRAAVFLIIDGDVSESLVSQAGHYNFKREKGSLELVYRPLHGETLAKKIRLTVGDSALYRYIQLNLRFDLARIVERARVAVADGNASREAAPVLLEDSRAVVDQFLSRLSPALKMPPACVALLFHTDTYAISAPADAIAPKDSPQVMAYFGAEARRAGYRVVELADYFRADFAAHRQRLDFWPLDRHLNGRGHGIAAKAAFDALYADGRMECGPAVEASTVGPRAQSTNEAHAAAAER